MMNIYIYPVPGLRMAKKEVKVLSSEGTIKVLDQTGKHKSVMRDLGRKAKLPGQRVSETGKVYWETRKNRSDKANKKL